MNQDQEHLNLLSIFHYIVAVIAALLACFPLIHFFMGLSMLAGWGNAGMETMIALFMMAFAGLFVLGGWAFAICMFIAGRYLAERTHYQFCLVMACIACIFMPFGTVLGVFTILVLIRPSVKALFGAPPAGNATVPVPTAPPLQQGNTL